MLIFKCVIAWCTLHHDTIAINYSLGCYSTTMAMAYGSGRMLMLIGMEPYCVGCKRTGSTLVLVHVWIWICHCLVYNTLWHHHICIPSTIQLHNDVRLCADIDCMYATVSCCLWMNRKYVGIGACLNLNVSLLGMINHDTIAIQLQLRWHMALHWC